MKVGSATLLLLCAVTFFGCGPKPTPTLHLYCTETFWYVMQEEAIVFNRIYGFRVLMHPIQVPRTADKAEDTVEINDRRNAPVLWRNRPGAPAPQEVETRAKIHPEIERQLEGISEEHFGDLFLSDSRRHLEKLHQIALTAGEFPVCYLTLTMLVPQGNPNQFQSTKDVLESNRRLGIVDPSLDGLGESSWEMLGRIVSGGESAIPMDLVQLYERQYDLLEALEQRRIDAALVWTATSQLNFLLVKYADEYNTRFAESLREAERSRNPEVIRLAIHGIAEILVEQKKFAEEIPLTENPDERFVIAVRLAALSSTTNYEYCKRFADFMRSNQSKEILQRFGFVPE